MLLGKVAHRVVPVVVVVTVGMGTSLNNPYNFLVFKDCCHIFLHFSMLYRLAVNITLTKE